LAAGGRWAVSQTMTAESDIQTLAQKIRRDRKWNLILSPFMVAFFAFTTWLNFHRAAVHFETLAQVNLPTNATPDMIRMSTLRDAIPLILSFILILISIAALSILVFVLVVPNRKDKLLLALADQLNGQTGQPRSGGDSSARAGAACGTTERQAKRLLQGEVEGSRYGVPRADLEILRLRPDIEASRDFAQDDRR
jgi:hypothetical protein